MNNKDKSQENLKNNVELKQQINDKINYLTTVRNALIDNDDLKLYKLINSENYNQFANPTVKIANSTQFTFLISDLKPEISHHLSDNLIKYLGNKYPFFYYNEYENGRFNIYFGNWWDHRLFGNLDVLNVKFRFNQDELDSLKTSFELEKDDKNVHSDKITELSSQIQKYQTLRDNQSKRDAKLLVLQEQLRDTNSKGTMPWESGKLKEAKERLKNQISDIETENDEAAHANEEIEDIKKKIINLTKQDTILSYEKQSIRDTFGTFNDFLNVQNNLYNDYLTTLIHGKDGESND